LTSTGRRYRSSRPPPPFPFFFLPFPPLSPFPLVADRQQMAWRNKMKHAPFLLSPFFPPSFSLELVERRSGFLQSLSLPLFFPPFPLSSEVGQNRGKALGARCPFFPLSPPFPPSFSFLSPFLLSSILMEKTRLKIHPCLVASQLTSFPPPPSFPSIPLPLYVIERDRMSPGRHQEVNDGPRRHRGSFPPFPLFSFSFFLPFSSKSPPLQEGETSPFSFLLSINSQRTAAVPGHPPPFFPSTDSDSTRWVMPYSD